MFGTGYVLGGGGELLLAIAVLEIFSGNILQGVAECSLVASRR